MNKDEEYVRSVWKELRILKHRNHRPYWINNGVDYLGSGPFSSTDEMWSAAAEFTRERVEQVRQLRASISELLDDLCEDDKCKRCIRFKFAASQLQVILSERTAGMKPEAL